MVIATKVGMLKVLDGLSAGRSDPPRKFASAPPDRPHRPLHHAHATTRRRRWPRRSAPSTRSSGRESPPHRRFELHSEAPGRSAGRLAAKRLRAVLGDPAALQLVHRAETKASWPRSAAAEGIACFRTFRLAKGFLTGKYRPGTTVDSPRSKGASAYLDDRGLRVRRRRTPSPPRTARRRPLCPRLAWSQPTSARRSPARRTAAQLVDLLPSANLRTFPKPKPAAGRSGELMPVRVLTYIPCFHGVF